MQFGISRCAMLEMKRSQFVQSKGTELPNGETIKSLEDEKEYKYLGVPRFDSVNSKEMKDMITKECYGRIKKARRNAGKTIQAINAKVVLIIRHRVETVE